MIAALKLASLTDKLESSVQRITAFSNQTKHSVSYQGARRWD